VSLHFSFVDLPKEEEEDVEREEEVAPEPEVRKHI